MEPTIKSGQEIEFEELVNQTVSVGDIVLSKHPFKKKIIIVKRVKSISRKKLFFLQGDNPLSSFSSDSRSFGPVSKQFLIGISKAYNN